MRSIQHILRPKKKDGNLVLWSKLLSNISLSTAGIVGYYDMQDCTRKVKIEKQRQALPFLIQNGETATRPMYQP